MSVTASTLPQSLLELPSGSFVLNLQYIEPPESGGHLNQTVLLALVGQDDSRERSVLALTPSTDTSGTSIAKCFTWTTSATFAAVDIVDFAVYGTSPSGSGSKTVVIVNNCGMVSPIFQYGSSKCLIKAVEKDSRWNLRLDVPATCLLCEPLNGAWIAIGTDSYDLDDPLADVRDANEGTKKKKKKKQKQDSGDSSDEESEPGPHVIILTLDQCHSNNIMGAVHYADSHGEASSVNCLSHSASSAMCLLSGGSDGLVNLFDVSNKDEDEALLMSYNADAPINTVKFANTDESWICATTDDHGLYIWDRDSADVIFLLRHLTPGAIIRSPTATANPNNGPKHPIPQNQSIFVVDTFAYRELVFAVITTTSDANDCSAANAKTYVVQCTKGNKNLTVVQEVSIPCGGSNSHVGMIGCAAWCPVFQTLTLGSDDGVILENKVSLGDSSLKAIKNKDVKSKKKHGKPY